MTKPLLSQRADYTYKANARVGRHGWLRLTPAYSVKIVEEIVGGFSRPMRVLDPFSGTGTTTLSAAYHGHEALSTDINPFLVWFGNAKIDLYTRATLQTCQLASERVLDLVKREAITPVAPPPLHNIERWWSEKALAFLCLLRAAIDTVTEDGSQERTLLLIAFCRTLMKLSNAAFNHQSMSFKSDTQLMLPFDTDMELQFAEDVRFVLQGAEENPDGAGEVLLEDARHLRSLEGARFDQVITSPPYANRMSYIRELRPYMYWLGYLNDGREAGEIDWAAIGGTWGIATSRLSDWRPDAADFRDSRLQSAISAIEASDTKSATVLARYVEKYFSDMWKHFQALSKILNNKAAVHYIVGNSTFYGVLLPVEEIYAAMLREIGFVSVTCHPIRKRNSKKELVEFDVSAIWNP